MKRRHWILLGGAVAVAAAVYLGAVCLLPRGSVPGEATPGSSLPPPAALPSPRLSIETSVEQLKHETQRVAEELVAAHPDDAEALNVKARVQFSVGRRSVAVALWRRCIELDPGDAAEYYSAIGLVSANGGAHEEAVEAYQQALDGGSRDPHLPVLLADCLMKTGRLEEAAMVLDRQLQSGTFTGATMTTLGQAYLQLEQYDESRAMFQAAIRAAPNDKQAHYGMAMACARSGRRDEARNHMAKFAKLDAEAFSERAEGLRTFDDHPSSQQAARRTLIDAARCYRKHERLERAEELLRNAAALEPDDVESRTELMTLYEQLGRDARALEICHQLREIDPRHGDYWMNIGVLSARLGDFETGLTALRQAMKLDPDNAQYREVYGVIEKGK